MTPVFRSLLALFFLLLSTSAAAESLEGLSEWLESEQERWQIPGMAVAVVHGDERVFSEGFGILGLEDSQPVDGKTIFGIASLSKAFTATALGMLVDEGKLDYDDRVIDHMPDFRLSDPWVTAHVTVRDLLTHQVGVGRMLGNRLQFMTNRPRSELIYRMRYHDFEKPFRQEYVYSNVMYTVAGELIPAVTGQSWDDFLADRIFTPLGMERTGTRIDALEDLGNAAWPHQDIRGEIIPIDRRNFDNAGPSAAINSSMEDLVQWMRMNLGDAGAINGERLVSEETMAKIHQPWVVTGFDEDDRTISAYGLGWGLSRYQGYQLLQHNGATDGMNSVLTLVPELDLGIVMSSNLFNTLRGAVVRRIIDQVAGHEEKDWGEEYFEEFTEDREKARKAREEKHARRVADTSTSLPQSDFAGKYSNPLYDTIEVVESDDGELALQFWDDNTLVADLEHWHFDTFRAHWRNPAQREKFVWFALDEDGRPHVLNVRFTLRPEVLEEGIYPADYTRDVRFIREAPTEEDSG